MTDQMEARERMRRYLAAHHPDVVELCQALIRIPSEDPPGDTCAIAAYIQEFLEARGIRTATHGPDPTRPNVVGRVELPRPGPRVVFNGHMETLPVGDPARWTHDPLAGAVVGSRLYGRRRCTRPWWSTRCRPPPWPPQTRLGRRGARAARAPARRGPAPTGRAAGPGDAQAPRRPGLGVHRGDLGGQPARRGPRGLTRGPWPASAALRQAAQPGRAAREPGPRGDPGAGAGRFPA
jgi:hypothetical protein